MKLLYVIDSLAPGGAETSLAAMAPGLREQGIDLIVATFWNRPGVEQRLRDGGATLVDLGAPTSRAKRAMAVRDAVKAHRPDLVHTTLFESDVAGRVGARLAGTPVVTSLVNEQYGPEHRVPGKLAPVKKQLARGLDAYTGQLARAFHAISVSTADVMSRRLGIRRTRITVIHRGRDGELLGRRTPERRARVRDQLGLNERERVVLAVGRQEPQKGFDVLLEALAEVPNATLLVAGREGNASPEIVRGIKCLGLGQRVRLLGHRADAPDLMVAADVLAFPSRFEGLGGTCIEALALELPVVASDLGPVREVLGDAAVGYAAVGDAGAVAAHLRRALDDPDAMAELASRGRVRFDSSFQLDAIVRQMSDWYRAVHSKEHDHSH